MPEIIKTPGKYADRSSDPENKVTFHFYPKKKNGKLGYSDVIRELFDLGMEGGIYVQLFKVPGEFPHEEDNDAILMDVEDACKYLAATCDYKLYDDKGRELV